MTRYWCSWYEPVADWAPDQDEPMYSGPEWPDTVRVIGTWATGFRHRDAAQTVCALVDSASRLAVETALEGRDIRFFEERSPDWTPGERFPLDEAAEPDAEPVVTPAFD